MANKIYIEDNYFFLILDGATVPLSDGKSKVNINVLELSPAKYLIESPLIGVREILLSTMVDGSDVAYTQGTWDAFYKANTGFNTATGGSVADVRYISNKHNLPLSSSGVITLLANVTYLFTRDVDLLGDRLVCGENTTILGFSSENCSLTSTGLGVGVPLITSLFTVPIRHINFKDIDTVLGFDGSATTMALDWTGVNFENVPNIGTVKDADNFIFSKGAFLNSKGLKFDGSVGTIGVQNSIFVGDGLAGNIFEVLATATITRRFRINDSSIIATSPTIGINISASATIPVSGYILTDVNFSGGGTYLSGVTDASDLALFRDCVGIVNTAVNGQLYMQGNATVTPIAVVDTFYKVLGTTIPSPDNAKYTHANNRLTNDSVIQRKYLIQCNLSFNSGNNNVCTFGFYDSKLGSIRVPSKTSSTANAGGRSENISFSCVVQHSLGDYLEIHGANASLNDITVTEMNFIITEIK